MPNCFSCLTETFQPSFPKMLLNEAFDDLPPSIVLPKDWIPGIPTIPRDPWSAWGLPNLPNRPLMPDPNLVDDWEKWKEAGFPLIPSDKYDPTRDYYGNLIPPAPEKTLPVVPVGTTVTGVIGAVGTGTSIFASLYAAFTFGANLGCSYRRAKLYDAYNQALSIHKQMKNQFDGLKKQFANQCGKKDKTGQFENSPDCPDECNDLKTLLDTLSIDLFRISQDLQCIDDALDNMNCYNPIKIAANNLWAERAEKCGVNMVNDMKEFDNLMNQANAIINNIKKGTCGNNGLPKGRPVTTPMRID